MPSSSPTPPASSPPTDSNLPPPSLSAHPSLVLSNSSEKAPAPGCDTDDEETIARVPSSNTPSPLKLPSEQTDPAAQALHESISNLLGKRNAGAMAIEDFAEPPQRRKRARPRFKVKFGQSRLVSYTLITRSRVSSRIATGSYSSRTRRGRTPVPAIPASTIHRQRFTPHHTRSGTNSRKGPRT